MKFGYAKNEAERLVPDPFLVFKVLCEVKANVLELTFNILTIAPNLAYNENKHYKTLDS